MRWTALHSILGPPNHPNDRAWMAARDKLASSVHADAYTVHATPSLWPAERIVCPADRPHSTAHRLRAKDRHGTIPTEESLDLPGLPSRSGSGLRKMINSRRPEIAAVQQMSSAQSRPSFPDGSPRRRSLALGNTARIDTSDPCRAVSLQGADGRLNLDLPPCPIKGPNCFVWRSKVRISSRCPRAVRPDPYRRRQTLRGFKPSLTQIRSSSTLSCSTFSISKAAVSSCKDRGPSSNASFISRVSSS